MGQVCLAPLASIVNLVANYNIRNGYFALVIISIYLITMIIINSKTFENSYFYIRSIMVTILKSVYEWNINYDTTSEINQTVRGNKNNHKNNSVREEKREQEENSFIYNNYYNYQLYKGRRLNLGMRHMSTDSKSNKDSGISHSHFSHNESENMNMKDVNKDNDNENKGNNNIINLDINNNNYVNNEVKEILSHTESKFKNKYSGGFKSYKIRDNNILKGFTFEYSTELSKYTIDRKLLRNALQNYLNNLDESKVYSILFIATGITVNNSIMNNNVISDSSMLVTKDYPINTLVNVVYLFIDKYLSHYLPSHFNESGIYSLIVKEKV
jgi:hypothetical protein